MLWVRSDSSDAAIYGLLRYELQEPNKQAGIHFIRQNLYGDRILRRHWTTHNGSLVPFDKALFLSLPNKDCADSNTTYCVHC